MAKKDPRVDAYIANAADFARPILKHLRALIHAECPEVEETIKWGFPHFGRALQHGGIQGPLRFWLLEAPAGSRQERSHGAVWPYYRAQRFAERRRNY